MKLSPLAEKTNNQVTTMKKSEMKVATLVALAMVLSIAEPLVAGHMQGHDEADHHASGETPAIGQASTPKKPKGSGVIFADEGTGEEAGLPFLVADATCHNPCDDAFKLEARVKDASGRAVKGVKVAFSFQLASGLETGEAETNASGYAHLHLKLKPSAAPQGVRVEVTAQCLLGNVVKTATTWFTPNYS